MKRSLYSELERWKVAKNRKPLLLKGARQVGKTWLLKWFGEQSFRRTHYINFEEDERLASLFVPDLKPSSVVERIQLFTNTAVDIREDLIIFDEIQRCPRALTALKYFAEESPEIAVCAAGSLLGVSFSPEAYPVGKVDTLHLFPLSFDEFLGGIGEDLLATAWAAVDGFQPVEETLHGRLWDCWKAYLITGGLPEVVTVFRDAPDRFAGFQAARQVQRRLLDAYTADIAKHSGKINAMSVERVWRHVPGQLARSLDGSAPKFKFRDVIPGCRGYDRLVGPIDWLESAELVIRTAIVESPNDPLASQEKENAFKLYVADTGLLGALGNLSPKSVMEYGFGSYQGYVAENATAQAFRAAGVARLYCWQGRTAEVEFLIESAEGVIPIEVKSGHVTQSKSLGVFESRFAAVRSYVLSAGAGKQCGRRFYIPLYAAGRLAKTIMEGGL